MNATPTLEQLAEQLAVSADALMSLGVERNGNAWLIPERNADGEIIGQARRFDDGGKGFVAGGHRGLTYAAPLLAYAGTSADDPIIVVEGMTDTAAALDREFHAVGRPSATGGAEQLRALLRDRHAVIVGEHDASGIGEKAAHDLAAKLAPACASVRVVMPPAGVKDLRQWTTTGPAPADRTELLAAIRAAEPVKLAPTAPASAETFKPFPTDALPEPARSFVQACARAIGCDESFVALPLLAALASAIGNTRRIELKRGWTEPAIVWAVLVGDSGTLKSPALEAALRAIRKRQHSAMKRHAQAMELYRAEQLEYEKALTTWKKSRHSEAPKRPDEPAADRCWCDDVTVEALAVLLVNQWRGLLLVRDELAGWLGGFDRYAQGKGGDVAKWLEMFGGRSMMVDRKSGSPRTIYVPRAAVSVCGGIQPVTLARALGVEHRENGLAARLLLACPPRRPKRWTEADISPDLEHSIAALFERLYELQPATDEDGDAQPVIVRMSSSGKAAWVDFFNAHGQEQADLTGDLSAAWSKLEGYAARLALVVHFVRWAAGDPTLASADEIDADSIAAGVKLSRWFGNEARRAYAILSESDEERDRRRLVELIGRKGGTVTVRELQQTSRLFHTAGEAESALDALAEAGVGRWEQQGPSARGGRPTRIFRLSAPAPSTQPPEVGPPAPTKPPTAGPQQCFVDVGAVDAGEVNCGDDLGALCSDPVEDSPQSAR